MFGTTKAKFQMRGQFTPENSALVLVDYQVGTLQLIRSSSSDVSLKNAVMLATAAVKLNMPIVLTSSQEDQIQGPISPALQKAAVEATGRKNLIMGGVTTDICLVFPSISAIQLGYSVQAILDASGSSWAVQEEVTRLRMQQAGVVLTTTNTAIAELVQDWASPAGSELVKLLVSSAPMMQPAS